MRSTLLLSVAVAGLALAAAPVASANQFTINACAADRENHSTQAFEDFATRGMMWKRACNPFGDGLRGLITGNVARSGRVARGARSYFVLRAPEGTHFVNLNWSGHAQRRDCRYALQLWADRPGGSAVAIKNKRANEKCPKRGHAQAAAWPAPRDYPIAGTTRIVQRIVCVGKRGKPFCSARGRNYIRTFKAQVTVEDTLAPTVSILQDGPLARGEWVRGLQSVGYDAADNVGVRLARTIVGGVPRDEHNRTCDDALRVPCTNGPGAIRVETDSLIEGSQTLMVQAVDAANNVATSAPITVRIDNTAPGAVPIAVEGGEGWRNANSFDPVWSNPDEGDRAPIAAAHYRLCRTGGSECVTGTQSGPLISRLSELAAPAPGEWQLRVWRQDAAGNQEPANASVPVSLRYDPEPPQVAFEHQSVSDPTLVSALVTDKVSGPAGGHIELSREGSGTWQTLPTQLHGSRLAARVDDAHLPPGPYLLRATAHDQAANQTLSDRRADGQPMRVTLPLRIPTAMKAGVVAKRLARRTTERRGTRRHPRRRVITLEPRARAVFGRDVRIGGMLENRDGQPIADSEVTVYSRSSASAEQLVGVVRTDGKGRFTYVARASSTRTLRFVYGGTALMLPAEDEISLLVPAASTIKARPKRVTNGRAVRFAGRLRSLPQPPAGKLVELQVVLSGRWQTFRTVRTNASGAWRVRYRFRRSCGLLRYRFRARLPSEEGYPFETGASRAVSVRVRGEPCR